MIFIIAYIAVTITIAVWFAVATAPRNRARYPWLIQDEPKGLEEWSGK